jgi:hypothetical protein
MNPEKFVIPGDAYPYLVAQRGALDDMRDEPELWAAKYLEVLQSEMRALEPYLPATCETILDIGGGMGGIDVLLNEHYGGDCLVTLLDGMRDEPVVAKHSETFSNFEIARGFLELNGVRKVTSLDAAQPNLVPHFYYDLVISLKSWCFHYPPERYLDLVLSCVIPKQTVLIIDVRANNERYYDVLRERFGRMACIFAGPKFDTLWMMAQ